jgi:ATP-dependent Lon protease
LLKDIETEDPEVEDLHETGTLARVLKVLKMPDGSITAILQGRSRLDQMIRSSLI